MTTRRTRGRLRRLTIKDRRKRDARNMRRLRINPPAARGMQWAATQSKAPAMRDRMERSGLLWRYPALRAFLGRKRGAR